MIFALVGLRVALKYGIIYAVKTKKTNENLAKETAAKVPRVILIGTYKKDQLTAWRPWYCYPLSAADSIQEKDAARINELWLFRGTSEQKTYKAEFVGIKTRDELVKDYGYPAKGKAHGKAYLLFKTEFKYTFKDTPPTEADHVIIRTADFATAPKVRKQLKAYLESPDRTDPDLAKLVPSIVLSIPRQSLCVCEPVAQMSFLPVLDNIEEIQKAFQDNPCNAVRFIDLFAGIGGIRTGFEQACHERGFRTQCVFTSEIKPHALEILKQNHPNEYIHGDITQVDAKSIPNFDILLAGFPCQAFSMAGKRLGFEDTRGTLFFDVARILKEKQPIGFVLENVEGLVNHDRQNTSDKYGRTLQVILATLDELGYKVSWRVLNAKEFGVPQERKRIYIVGTKIAAPNLNDFPTRHTTIGAVLEHGLPVAKNKFVEKLLSHYSIADLEGKSIKDKRGGENNIHSWDFEYKGRVTLRQRELLNALLKERRKHQWADQYGIDWMDGMPLTLSMIRTFFDDPNLKEMLEDLVEKRYVVKEHPKRKVKQGNVFVRVQDPTLPLGYNIVAGKMSFEISKVMSPEEIAPTLVAMDMQHLYVSDGDGLRTLTLREGLNLFGYPQDFKFNIKKDLGYDLLGNTVVVPVIKSVSERLLNEVEGQGVFK